MINLLQHLPFPYFQKPVNASKELLSGVYVCKMLNIFNGKWASFDILRVENGHFFTPFAGSSAFSAFQICPIVGVQRCSGAFFAFLIKNWPKIMHHTDQNRAFQFDLSLTDLSPKYAHWDLRKVLWSIPDTIHVVLLTYLYLIRLLCALKPGMTNRQAFCCWPDRWRLGDPEFNSFGFPPINFPVPLNTVLIW